jgi:hypothetical protein
VSSPIHQILFMSDIGPAQQFLSRTSGLDATHINAYTALINGLVTDNVWFMFDALYIFATADSTTALLNLVSFNYNCTKFGSPTFTTDRGFTGTDGSSTIYLDTNFDWTAAPSPHLSTTLVAGHISAWSINNTTATTEIMGMENGSGALHAIYPRYTDGNSYNRVFSQGGGGVATATSQGHYLTNRTNNASLQAYKNAGNILNDATGAFNTPYASAARNMYICGANIAGTPRGSPFQCAMASIGGPMSSTDVTNFYNRLRTYMTAVGVP